jgi:putative cell wall-binding protein/Tol biopolymer transport system component
MAGYGSDTGIHRLRARVLVLVMTAALLGLPTAGGASEEGLVEPVSVTEDGELAEVDRGPAVSGDGRFVAFLSYDRNLDPDHEDDPDIYVRDRGTGRTELVTGDFDWRRGERVHGLADLSEDGRFVAFVGTVRPTRHASSPPLQVFVYDRDTGDTELVSATPDGVPGNSGSDQWAFEASISADGRFVAFTSRASDLVPGPWPDGWYDNIFVRDRLTATTALVSAGSSGEPGNQPSFAPAISADGRHVAFWSEATNLGPGAGPGLYVHDLGTGTTEQVQQVVAPPQSLAASAPALNGDGRYVAFAYTTVIHGEAPVASQVNVHDRQSGETTLISRGADGAPGDESSRQPVITPDGRYVAFNSAASNLAASHPGGTAVYLHDRQNGSTHLVERPPGSSDGSYHGPAVSNDATTVAFVAQRPAPPSSWAYSAFAWDAPPGPVTTAPSEPLGVSARPRDGAATVTWSPPWTPRRAPVDGYQVTTVREDGQTAMVPGPLTVEGSTTTATIEGLANGVAYRFTVTAANQIGTGPASAPSNLVAPRPAPEDVARLAGANRFATAAAVSVHTFPEGAPVAYVATGANYPDALTGAVRAVHDGGPVLLTRPDELPEETAAELARLNPARIVVLGGPRAVSGNVTAHLEAIAPVTRVAGVDRYATAAEIAEVFTTATVAYIATGDNFPDALAGSALASRPDGGPILLVRRDALPQVTRDALTRIDPVRIVILGGPAAVSAEVQDALAEVAPVTRLAGANRYATAAAIADMTDASTTVYVATGRNFPDALVGGVAAGIDAAPLLLVTTTTIPDPTDTVLGRLQPTRIRVLGGPRAVSQTVMDALAH